MTRSTRTSIVSAALTAALFLAGCGGTGGGSEEAQTATIGFSGPLSGGGSLYGENVLSGIQMAVADVNEVGLEVDGTPTELTVETLDDQYLPNEAGTNAERLVQQNDAAVVMIPHAGGIYAAQQINTARDDFLIGAYSSDPAILERENELTMMIPPRFDNYMPPFVETMMGEHGDRLGMIPTESEYGQQWTEQVTEEWEAQGGEVLSQNSTDYSTTTDFAGPVAQALDEDPDVLFVGGPSQPTALVIDEARQQGFDGGFLVMDQAKFTEIEQYTDFDNLEGSVGVQPVAESDSPGVEDFLQRYAEEVSDERPVVSEVALNYQATHIIAKAMEIAGTTEDPQAIRDSIDEAVSEVDDQYKVDEFPDSFTDRGHLTTGTIDAAYIEDGEYTPLEVPQENE